MKVLIVGGTFDRQGGKPSGLINKIYTLKVKTVFKSLVADICYVAGNVNTLY